MRYITKRISGIRPETEENQTIEITFAEVTMIGNPYPGYKATKYYCAHSDRCGCNSAGPDGRNCPLFKAGQQEVI